MEPFAFFQPEACNMQHAVYSGGCPSFPVTPSFACPSRVRWRHKQRSSGTALICFGEVETGNNYCTNIPRTATEIRR